MFASGGQGSLEEIASEAGVGIATLYRHFSGRESLTRAVYRSIMRDELLPLLRQSCAQGSARQSFLLVLDAATFAELARAEVPHAAPLGFHGQWYADEVGTL